MLIPSIFGETFFDDFMSPLEAFHSSNRMMDTDVKESNTGYELTMDIPGVRKEDVHAELKDGYLTIAASIDANQEEKDEKSNYIRRERHFGSASRTFYVGEEVTKEDIKAKFENGTLKLTIPKLEAKPEVEPKQYITIEG